MSKATRPAIVNQDYELVSVDSLRVHPRNANEGDVGAIHESVDSNGFYGALVVQRSTGYIVAGNHRYKAATLAGMDTLPVIYIDCDDEQAIRILLADNRTTRLGNDNPAKLAELLTELAATNKGLEGTGYDMDALDELLGDLDHDASEIEQHAPTDQGDKSVVCPHCHERFVVTHER